MRMVDAAYRAWELLWRDLGERLYHPTGVLALAGAAGGTGWIDASRATLLAGGHAVETLEAAAMAARWPMLSPEGIGDAFHLAPGGVLLARRIVAALAEHLRRRGVAFERARVVEAKPELAALHLADGRDRVADFLVIAAGPWAPRLLGAPLAEHVTASRQVLVLLEPPRPRRAAWARAPMLLDLEAEGGGGFYAVPPVAGTPLKIGDHRFSRAGDPEADPREASPQEAEAILALARRRIRDLGEYRVLGARACYYDVEPQERFVVEPVGPRAFVMSGFSGHGFKFGPLLGLALARAAGDAGLAPGLAAWAAGLEDPPFGLLADLEETAPPP